MTRQSKSAAAKWKKNHPEVFAEPNWVHKQLFNECYSRKPHIIPDPPRDFRKLPRGVRRIAHMLAEGLALSDITSETGLSTVEIDTIIGSFAGSKSQK